MPRVESYRRMGLTLALLGALATISLGGVLLHTSRNWWWLSVAVIPIVLIAVPYREWLRQAARSSKRDPAVDPGNQSRVAGLTLQGEGRLEPAFEAFKQCRPDDFILSLLYELALDFERTRQFTLAHQVYAYIGQHNPLYRDLDQRMAMNQALQGHEAKRRVNDDDPASEPHHRAPATIAGRYRLEQDLGKGAMGRVSLGRDIHTRRLVAIKTMDLSEEFGDDDLEAVKQRFFREAETAGQLRHPHIVAIHDAGEEQGLAYIAMELLRGQNLRAHTRPGRLLPSETVCNIIATCAETLDYAHGQQVVHRDIKPANIMYEPVSGDIKLTDFGIARMTDSSKTRAGLVLGTPLYMSPEQLAGHPVDGRSDLFSLGVTLFQLLIGRPPFQAGSIASLMGKITCEPHPSAADCRPELGGYLDIIMDKAMAKDREHRFQTGAEMASRLREYRVLSTRPGA